MINWAEITRPPGCRERAVAARILLHKQLLLQVEGGPGEQLKGQPWEHAEESEFSAGLKLLKLDCSSVAGGFLIKAKAPVPRSPLVSGVKTTSPRGVVFQCHPLTSRILFTNPDRNLRRVGAFRAAPIVSQKKKRNKKIPVSGYGKWKSPEHKPLSLHPTRL